MRYDVPHISCHPIVAQPKKNAGGDMVGFTLGRRVTYRGPYLGPNLDMLFPQEGGVPCHSAPVSRLCLPTNEDLVGQPPRTQLISDW